MKKVKNNILYVYSFIAYIYIYKYMLIDDFYHKLTPPRLSCITMYAIVPNVYIYWYRHGNGKRMSFKPN